MCSHYQSLQNRARYQAHFGVAPPAELGRFDIWPGDAASFIRRPRHTDADAAGEGDEALTGREALPGQFGLIPHWATDPSIARRTYNARSETAASKPSFRDAWRHGQRCIVPAEAFFEPDWRSGKAVATRITQADGQPLGMAGLWSSWKSSQGAVIHSYTLLTLNADAHPLMKQFHKPAHEKRMLVILPPHAYQDWLSAPAAETLRFMQLYPADRLIAPPEPAPYSLF